VKRNSLHYPSSFIIGQTFSDGRVNLLREMPARAAPVKGFLIKTQSNPLPTFTLRFSGLPGCLGFEVVIG
jgi:hypothetical protein